MAQARLSDRHHRERLDRMVNPEHRVAYYSQHIDTEAIDLSTRKTSFCCRFTRRMPSDQKMSARWGKTM